MANRLKPLIGYLILAAVGGTVGFVFGTALAQYAYASIGHAALPEAIIRLGSLWAAICAVLLTAFTFGLKLIFGK